MRVVSADTATIHDGQRTISVKKGDQIYVDFITAGKDPQKFSNPNAINLDRPDADYIHHGWGAHACLGRPIVTVALATQLKVFAKLTNLRRAPGADGEIKIKLVNGDIKAFLNEDGTEWSRFPTSEFAHPNIVELPISTDWKCTDDTLQTRRSTLTGSARRL